MGSAPAGACPTPRPGWRGFGRWRRGSRGPSSRGIPTPLSRRRACCTRRRDFRSTRARESSPRSSAKGCAMLPRPSTSAWTRPSRRAASRVRSWARRSLVLGERTRGDGAAPRSRRAWRVPFARSARASRSSIGGGGRRRAGPGLWPLRSGLRSGPGSVRDTRRGSRVLRAAPGRAAGALSPGGILHGAADCPGHVSGGGGGSNRHPPTARRRTVDAS